VLRGFLEFLQNSRYTSKASERSDNSARTLVLRTKLLEVAYGGAYGTTPLVPSLKKPSSWLF